MISRRMLAAYAAVTVLEGSANPVLAQHCPMAVDISAVQPGSLPERFVVARTGKGAPAAWATVEGPTAHGGRALAQKSMDRTDYRFPLVIDQNAFASNVEVTVRFKAVSGQVDRAGGVAVRLVDPNNYYVVRANALEDNVNLYRVAKGVRTQIRGARTRVSSGEWHALGLRAEGDRFAVSFDGKPLFTAADQTFTGSGKVALWTKADSVTRFDGLTTPTLPSEETGALGRTTECAAGRPGQGS